MFKRFSNKQLIIVLGSLTVLYLLSLVLGGKSERTFKKTISAIDTAKVNLIRITPPNVSPVLLSRAGNEWTVQIDGGVQAPTSPGAVKSALASIAFLEAKQLVSRNEDKWGEYKVDTAGTRVEVLTGEKKSLDLVLGRFEYKQTGMMSYVRENGSDETYLVNGFLESSFNRKADDWRNKTLLKGPQSEWMSITFTYPGDSSFQIIKAADNTWMLSDSGALNTSEVNSWLSAAANTNGTAFSEKPPVITAPLYQVTVQTTSGLVEVKAFEDENNQFILTSSQNPGANFADATGDIVKKLFVSKTKFLPKSD